MSSKIVEFVTLITEVPKAPDAVVIPPEYKLTFTAESGNTDFANVKFKIEPAVTYVEIDLKTLLSNTNSNDVLTPVILEGEKIVRFVFDAEAVNIQFYFSQSQVEMPRLTSGF